MAKAAKKSSAGKKSKAKKTSAKATTKSAATSAAKGNTKIDRSVTFEKLYKFNLFAAVANLVFAVLSVIFLSKQPLDITLAHSTEDELASGAGSVLGPAYTILATVELKYLLAVVFVISAVFSLLLATRMRNAYENGVKNSNSGLRWLFSGITFALILEIATLLGGIGDIITLKLVAGLILTTSLLAWFAERENSGSKKHFGSFYLSLFTGVIAWFPLLGSLIGTSLYGTGNFGWHVYVLALLVLLGFSSIGLAQYRHARDGVSAKGYLQLEGKYLSTDFLIKFAAFAVILLALYK